MVYIDSYYSLNRCGSACKEQNTKNLILPLVISGIAGEIAI